ncbi:MAG: hypothetical protein AAF827_09415 [Cyanobacteria bacterium P01_D01_bin.6]
MEESNGSATSPINVQLAAQKAVNYLQRLAPQMGDQITNTRLEEIELSEDESFWFITLGFDRLINDQFLVQLQPKVERDYRQFKIDAATGEVKAMKIRTV